MYIKTDHSLGHFKPWIVQDTHAPLNHATQYLFDLASLNMDNSLGRGFGSEDPQHFGAANAASWAMFGQFNGSSWGQATMGSRIQDSVPQLGFPLGQEDRPAVLGREWLERANDLDLPFPTPHVAQSVRPVPGPKAFAAVPPGSRPVFLGQTNPPPQEGQAGQYPRAPLDRIIESSAPAARPEDDLAVAAATPTPPSPRGSVLDEVLQSAPAAPVSPGQSGGVAGGGQCGGAVPPGQVQSKPQAKVQMPLPVAPVPKSQLPASSAAAAAADDDDDHWGSWRPGQAQAAAIPTGGQAFAAVPRGRGPPEPRPAGVHVGMRGQAAPGWADGPTEQDIRPVDFRGRAPQWIRDSYTGVQGFKVFVGDLPSDTTPEDFVRWVAASPTLGSDWAVAVDLHADCRVMGESGSARAIVTVSTPQAAYALYQACWLWWARVPPSMGVRRPWRWVTVRFME